MAGSASRVMVALGTCCLGATAQVCPPGQYEVCVTYCICVPDARQVLGSLPGEVIRVAAGAMQHWLVQARADAQAAGVKPIPPDIRRQLTRYYDAALLDAVRYRVGNRNELGTAAAMLNDPDTQAVTLVDIILFRNEEGALHDVALWAHELKHVQQYREWGVEEFARRYTEDAAAVEEPAYEMQSRVTKALQGK
ncbi:DUF4157 domain-containing protein [Metapseudomonas lalkuanensis]|uniref:DUF4157 domain-containing protein n=1 Tax=Metapseudomonas lalkuanensis TaxID=2604832 RepID=A0A5J6QJT4_9GAMM|nr:DUF4157 domain-containing protein [Pseudomonas lalkuanensis]QEY62784.1 DUF4157 domain-containing protein [Pseudomonas lalkuanensis]